MSHTIEHLESHHAPRKAGKMRAGVYRGKGQVVVESVPIPEIGEGEVLFRVAACGICGTDIKKIHHGFVAPPQILGHELAGTVVAVGRGVTKFKPGDRVVSFHHIPCGDCFYCEEKLFSQCAGYKKTGLTAGFDPNGGGFAEYVRAMPWIVERGMIALPADVSFEEATFVEPVNTCLKAVRKARVKPAENSVGDRARSDRNAADDSGEIRRRGGIHERSDAGPPRGQPALRRERSVRSGRAKFAAGNSRNEPADAARTRCCSPCRTRHWFRKLWHRAAGRSRATVCT